MSDEATPVHDFADKALREALTHPENLKAFISHVLPEWADRFQFSDRLILPRNFLLDDWRDREADLLIEVPYRGEVGTTTMMVSILVEHQSTEDSRMPLRTLLYTLLYWDRKWKDWEQLPAPRERFSLPAILPIILYTGPGRWTTNRTLADLIDGPEILKRFAPRWEPIFWELSEQDPDALINSKDAFMKVMAVMQMEDADQHAAAAVFQRAMKDIGKIHKANPVLWHDLVKLVMGWVDNRRPSEERESWWKMAETINKDKEKRKDLRSLKRSYAQVSRAEGKAEGTTKGLVEGRCEMVFSLILRRGCKRFGEPSKKVHSQIELLTNLDLLESLADHVWEIDSWKELIEAVKSV